MGSNPRAAEMRRAIALAAAALVALTAGCGADDEAVDAGGEAAPTVTTVTVPAEQPAAGGQADRPPAAQQAGDDDDDRCRRVDRTGPIDMAGAGSVRLSRSGDRLSVSRVRPDDGWRATVDRDDDRDEVDVEFRRGDREVELAAEIDDGRLSVDVCSGRADDG